MVETDSKYSRHRLRAPGPSLKTHGREPLPWLQKNIFHNMLWLGTQPLLTFQPGYADYR